MKQIAAGSAENYVFCVEKQIKDGFDFEAKSRNLYTGKFYDVRFCGRKKYLFYIFDKRQWNVYFMKRDFEYYPSAFKGTNDFIRLEKDINSGTVKPELIVRGTKVKRYRSNGGAKIELPDFPFFYPPELSRLDYDTQKKRYNYSDAPKYLITARKSRYIKPGSAPSLYIFGCNNDELYKSICTGRSICVTHTYENERAVAVSKCVNSYDIIPFQHCLKTL